MCNNFETFQGKFKAWGEKRFRKGKLFQKTTEINQQITEINAKLSELNNKLTDSTLALGIGIFAVIVGVTVAVATGGLAAPIVVVSPSYRVKPVAKPLICGI